MGEIKLIKNKKTGIIEAFKSGKKIDEIINIGDEVKPKEKKNNSKSKQKTVYK